MLRFSHPLTLSVSQTALSGTERRCRYYSAFLPLHEGLIVTTDGEETLVASAEHDTDDVLGVTAVASGLAFDARVVEEVHETEIVTSGEDLLVVGAANGVDMGAIGASGVDTSGLPEELAGGGGPLSVLEVGTA